MTEFIIWVVLVSLWCWGVNNAFAEGEIFGKIGDWARETLPTWVVKPTIGCPKCMASIHGFFWFVAWAVYHSNIIWGPINVWVYLLLFIVSVSGLNTVIINFLNEEDDD